MKTLLYIYIGNFDERSGVTNKLNGLFSALDQANVQWTLFSVSKTVTVPSFVAANKYFLPVKSLTDNNFIYKELESFITHHTYDICFFRYPLASYPLFKLIKKHRNKLIFEHNTKEFPEVRQQGLSWVKKFKIRPTPSYFKLVLNTFLRPVFDEAYYSRKILSYAKMGIAVTNEIAEYEKAKFNGYVCHTISNGIDVSQVDFFNRKFERGDVLNLIMLANSNVDWHGIDIILESFLKYTKNNIKIFFVGDFDDTVKQSAVGNSNIVFTGFLSPEGFKDYLKNTHVGLGSFAAYRKKLEEGCSLKLREYWASGLPVFLGYKDTDVIKSEGLARICLYKDARVEKIDWEEVYNWATDLYLDDNLNHKIREEALKTIDFSIKARELINLF